MNSNNVTSKVNHIAIILDGNRRFAQKLMLEPWKGHEYGQLKVEKLLEWCKELGARELTLYTFSMQNFNRPKPEFDFLMKLFIEAFTKFYDDPKIEEYGVKVNFIGRYKLFPKEVVYLIEKIISKTKNNSNFVINLAMAYGGREELLDAISKIVEDVKLGKITEVTEEIIEKNLYMQSQPEIIIRTGGEKRTSNFLMWQSFYSEWFFIDKTWPEFEKTDLIQILEEYSQRERRFGR